VTRTRGGDKRSSWLIFGRRLFLVRRLIRGPAAAATLIGAAREALGDEIYPAAATAALRHDFAALRNEFECVIHRDAHNVYTLDDLGRLAVLDLPDPELDALAFLRATFAAGGLPNAPQVQALLQRVCALLPEDRRRQLAGSPAYPRLAHPTATSGPAAAVLATVRRAVGQQQLEFTYASPYLPAGETEWHRVAPYDLVYRDGHIYLEAYCYESSTPRLATRTIDYRLDRIASAGLRVLPARLPPGRMPRPSYALRYWLSPHVAHQHDILLWFPESALEFAADGSVLVTARITDLWQARQVLLGYREHCRVLAPPELVDLMRESVTRLAQLYKDGGDGAAPSRQ